MNLVSVQWIESKLMLGIDSNGTPTIISSWSEHEPKVQGLRPVDMLLLAAASCTLYDVVEILQKQRQPLRKLVVTCDGERASDHPRRFTKIHLIYYVTGDVDPAKLEKAIQLSEEKYCSVTNTLRGSVEITHEYRLEP